MPDYYFPNDPVIDIMISEGWDLDDCGQLVRPGCFIFTTKQQPTEDNPYCHIDKLVDGKIQQVLRSRLVCTLAYGKPKAGQNICDHIDGNKFNDHPDNLRWVTRSENAKNVSDEAVKMRNANLAKAHAKNRKLSDEDVMYARRERWLASAKVADLSKIYGVSNRYMVAIVNYKARTNVIDPLYPELKFEVLGYDEAA